MVGDFRGSFNYKITGRIVMKPLLLIIFLLLTLSCQERPSEPQDPIWERESCANCRMVLSEKRYAVQRILDSGETHFYDDINCAMKHHHHPHEEGKLYVRPYGDEKWVPAEEVTYQSGLRTPMNSGYGAMMSKGDTSYQELVGKFKE